MQPGVVDKSFFLGADLEDFRDDPEFRTKSYNIDSAANTDSYSGTIGGSSAVDRVRWEVTEGHLFARRSYQESPGADQRALPRKETSPGNWQFPGKPTGTIIAAFKIDSHFDIRRDYNPQTGEEANVIVENTNDRPWQQRQYMRVDWSKNLADSTSGDISWVFGEGTKATAVEYSATNESDEDRPRFEPETGYFDITNKYQLAPEIVPSWGVPECVIVGFFNGGSSFDCTPTEVKVRHSFVRLTGKEDFEPFEESMAPRDIVGNWGNAGNSFNREYGAPPVTTWDPQYGYTDAKTKTFYSFHNIWAKSHQEKTCASNVDEDKDGTADSCANEVTKYSGSRGSQCDVHIGKCTIPVRDREIQTIGYWLNPEAPVDLQDEVSADGKTITKPGALEEMTITWNQILKVAVATRREVECRRTGDGDRDSCHALYFEGTGPDAKEMVAFGGWGIDKTKPLPVDKNRPVITTCHNPVRAYDEPICGTPGEAIRLGDLRKNYAIYWPYASRAPYGGVATIGADPLTGEMLGVTATTMMRSATAAAAQQRDIIQLALGDLKVEELIEGVQASRYADVVKNGKVSEGMAKAKTAEEIAAAIKHIDMQNVQATIAATQPAAAKAMKSTTGSLAGSAKSAKIARIMSQIEGIKLKMKASPKTASMTAADQQVATLLNKLNSSELKTAVAPRSLQRLAAESKDKNTSVYKAIAAFSQMDPDRISNLLDEYQSYLGRKGMCFSDMAANAGAGSIYQPALAPYFKKLYGGLDPKERGVKIYKDLLWESVKGISFHEIGHSLGMRHNFASSWDSQNYLPQYWQLRTNEGLSAAGCTGPRSGGADTCMGPRYLDPLTDDEQGLGAEPRPGLEYFGNTSTMEYQIERFGETAGAGTYDVHFMKTVYGRVLETFDERQVPPDQQQYFAVKTLSQGISDELVFDPEKGYGAHYTKAARLAKVFDPARDCRAATDQEREHAKWRIVHGKVCSPGPKNHLNYEDMKSTEIAFDTDGQIIPIGVDGIRWQGTDETGKKLVRWHYRYGEDYSRGGYIHAKLFDSGSDIYEITLNVAKRFELTYPWQYFRRQNKEFAWWSIANSIANTTYSRLRAYHWSTTTDIGRASAADLNDDDLSRPAVMASAEMFNILQRSILMPEPGDYGPGANTAKRTAKRPGALTVYDLVDRDGDRAVASLGIVDSRFVQVDFDNAKGGSWDYTEFPHHTGFDEEKVLAIRELVDSRPTLSTVSRDNALDGRDPYISFRTDTPHAIDRLVGAMLSEDWETIAPNAVGADMNQLAGFSVLDKDPAKLVRPAGANIIFPNMGYSNQLGTGIYAMLFSRFSTDMVLFNKMRIRLDGDAGPTIPADRRQTFVDPVTGYKYFAAKYGTETIQGRPVEMGIGSRMLQRANDLMATVFETTTLPSGEIEPVVVGGIPTKKAGVKPADELNYRRYVGFLDAMRQVGNIFGGGPLGYGGGGDE